jgi:hypothetical protein
MRIRSLIAVATVAPLLAGVGAAHAAKKPPVKRPVCNLIPDSAGDGSDLGVGGLHGPNDPNLDILSADVATNATTLTAVIRVAGFSATSDTAPTGRAYDLVFHAGTKNVLVRALVNATGNTWAGGAGTGTVDTAAKEVRISVPLAKLPVPIKVGDKLTELQASTWRWGASTDAAIGSVDTATSVLTYTAGWPSCVKVGA